MNKRPDFMFSTIEINLVLWFMAFVAASTQSITQAKGTILIGFVISAILQYWAYYTLQKESKNESLPKKAKKQISPGLAITGWLLIVYGLISFCMGKLKFLAHSLPESQAFIGLAAAFPRSFIAIGMFTGGVGVLRLKTWGRWLVATVLLADFGKRLFLMFISSYFNSDLSYGMGPQAELGVYIFFTSLLLELLGLLYLMRPKVKEQFK